MNNSKKIPTAEAIRESLFVALSKELPAGTATDLFNDGYIDSLSLVEVVCLLEREYGVELKPDDITLDNFCSIEVMVKFVARLQKANNE